MKMPLRVFSRENMNNFDVLAHRWEERGLTWVRRFRMGCTEPALRGRWTLPTTNSNADINWLGRRDPRANRVESDFAVIEAIRSAWKRLGTAEQLSGLVTAVEGPTARSQDAKFFVGIAQFEDAHASPCWLSFWRLAHRHRDFRDF